MFDCPASRKIFSGPLPTTGFASSATPADVSASMAAKILTKDRKMTDDFMDGVVIF
jgi:hypothetical protein